MPSRRCRWRETRSGSGVAVSDIGMSALWDINNSEARVMNEGILRLVD